MIRFLHQISAFVRPHMWLLVFAWFAMAVNAAATGAYAYLIGPVVKFLFAGGLSADDSLTGVLESLGIGVKFGDSAWLLAVLPLLILVTAFVKGFSQFVRQTLMGRFGARSAFGIRAALVRAIGRAQLKRLDSFGSGDLVMRATSDTSLVEDAVTNGIGSLLADSLKIIVLLVLAVWLDWRLALVAALVLPLTTIPIVLMGRWVRRTAEDKQKAQAQVADFVRDEMAGRRLIRAYRMEETRQARFLGINIATFRNSMRALMMRAISSPTMEFIGAAGLCATLWFAGRRMAEGSLVPEHFVSFFAAVLLLYEPIKNLGRLNAILQSGLAGMERVRDIIGWEEEQDSGLAVLDSLNRGIQFKDLRFAYESRPVLDSISFTIQAGEAVALVGESGCGKTTLASLLMGFERAQSGSILLDGIDSGELSLDSLRNLITLVEQRPVLFDVSLIENVRIGKPEADEAEVLDAMRAARLGDLIARLTDGARTRPGEDGVRLSEGEKQRISLARAILRGSSVIILDEVTSALDAANEAAIRDALLQLAGTRTLLIIAHRETTIKAANRVLVLEGGRIVEEGAPSELQDANGPYSRLIDAGQSM